MGDTSVVSGKLNDSGVMVLTGKIMVVAIIVLFLVVVFVFFLHLYAKWYWHRRQEDVNNGTTRRRRRRFDFAPGYQELNVIAALRKGLDPSVLKSIPVVEFSPQIFKDGLECAVCLCEVSEGEKTRLLPRCNHGFHVECIDMWFQSHSTCPLCRDPVGNQSPDSGSSGAESTIVQVSVEESSTESPSFPTNVLFWGNETQVSTLGPCIEDGLQGPHISSQSPCSSSSSSSSSTSTSSRPLSLVIDIPRQINEEEEQKSPMPTRLRSLKRLLSRDRRASPRGLSNNDVEQMQT